jgi:xylitol oxidase
MPATDRNWAGNIAYRAARLHEPRTLSEVQDIVRRATKVRALGSRHSFNRIADTDADHVSMRGLNQVLALDKAARTVTVAGGITYGELCPALDREGYALHNLASLPHISVAGAAATATHGSGVRNKNLATAVSALKLVTASGDIVALKRGDPEFAGAVAGLGALGLVSELTLDLEPSFSVRQNLYLDLPFATLLDNFAAIMGAAYSVSLFTPWRGENIGQVWVKARADAPSPAGDFFGAKPATRPWHPIPQIDPTPCTEQMGVPGPWYLRLPHFRMEFTPSAGAELQSEYFVAIENAVPALQALKSIEDKIAPELMISEIRTIAADDLWMSPAYRQDCVAFHFTFKPDWPAVEKVLPQVEWALRPFGARPHWGKLFTMTPADVQAGVPRLADFRTLLATRDPAGKFRNAFVETYVT